MDGPATGEDRQSLAAGGDRPTRPLDQVLMNRSESKLDTLAWVVLVVVERSKL